MSNTLVRAFSDRALVTAIILSWIIHAVALLAMVTVLDPGVNVQGAAASRAAYVAAYPDRWKLGWLSWQLTALSDILVSVTLVMATWRLSCARGWALFGLVANCFAVVPDQLGEFRMVTVQIEAARAAGGGAAALTRYVDLESWLLILTGTFGCFGYALMSVGWLGATVAWAGAGAAGHPVPELGSIRAAGLSLPERWSRLALWCAHRRWAFGLVGAVMCALFMLCAGTNYYSASRATASGGYPHFAITFALNAVGFPLLMVWMAWMLPLVTSRQCPGE